MAFLKGWALLSVALFVLIAFCYAVGWIIGIILALVPGWIVAVVVVAFFLTLMAHES